MTPSVRLPAAVEDHLRGSNPWWQGEALFPTPAFRRWAFYAVQKKMDRGLAPAVVLRGPRQVGKTTVQLQLIEHLLRKRKVEAARILLVQFDELPSMARVDDPLLAIARWFERSVLRTTFNAAARKGQPAYIFLDEVQNLADWAPQLKALVDHHAVKVMVTGSSALQIAEGRDSLAGRIALVELGPLLLREISELRFERSLSPLLPENGLEALLRQELWQELQAQGVRNRSARDRAFGELSRRGGYPMVHAHAKVPWAEVADQLNETMIRRVLEHDLRKTSGGRGRDRELLETVFRLACRYAGQTPSQAVFLAETRQALQASVSWKRIWTYLNVLDGSLLLKLLRPLELRLKRSLGADKLCLCDHALRASWLEEVIPIDAKGLAVATHLSDLAGHIAESVAGYFLASIPHLDVSHFPERSAEPEVDFVLTVGDTRIPLEIKYRQRIDPHRDTVGIRAFLEKTAYNAPFGVLVTLHDGVKITDPRIVAVSLASLLLLR
jgi:predicted AAA+ superfamily ATPase